MATGTAIALLYDAWQASRVDEPLTCSNGRLADFFPGRVDVRYARECKELEGSRFFSFLTAGESLVLAEREDQPEPLGWLQCEHPRLTLVGEQQGIYAAYIVGGEPVRPPTPEDCHITTTPGRLVDGCSETPSAIPRRRISSHARSPPASRDEDRADELLNLPRRRHRCSGW
jgi:hypothetical protein